MICIIVIQIVYLVREGNALLHQVNYLDQLLIVANGDIGIIEEGLGIETDKWAGQELVRIDIDKSIVNDFYESGNLKLPTGSESGANSNWIPGGETSGGIAEAILSDCPTSNIDRVGTTTAVNGVPTEQLNNLYNSLGGDSNALKTVTDAVDDIPRTNIDENALLKNITTGKTNVIDAIDDVSTLPGRSNGTHLGVRVGAVLGVLGTVGDVADVVTTASTAYQQYKNGDIEGATDTLGSWGMSTLGGMAGGAGAGALAGIGMGTLVAAGLVSGPIGWAAIAAAGLAGGILGGFAQFTEKGSVYINGSVPCCRVEMLLANKLLSACKTFEHKLFKNISLGINFVISDFKQSCTVGIHSRIKINTDFYAPYGF